MQLDFLRSMFGFGLCTSNSSSSKLAQAEKKKKPRSDVAIQWKNIREGGRTGEEEEEEEKEKEKGENREEEKRIYSLSEKLKKGGKSSS